MIKSEIIWHELYKRPMNEDEKEKFQIFSESYITDCDEYPEDREEVLVAIKTGDDSFCVRTDTAYEDYGLIAFDYTDIENVVAWAEFPKYEKREQVMTNREIFEKYYPYFDLRRVYPCEYVEAKEINDCDEENCIECRTMWLNSEYKEPNKKEKKQ